MPKQLVIKQIEGKPGKVYYPLELKEIAKPSQSDLKPNQVLIKVSAAALNHRDLFIRQHLYPGTAFGVPLFSDGVGTVEATGSDSSASKWRGKRVVLNPGTGWKDDLDGPEAKGGYKILGGTKLLANGTGQEFMVIEADELEEAPEHLDDIQAAAVPLTGLTAWRAVMVKCGEKNVGPGRRVLVTGIGGGVALMALEFAKRAGADVYVTSGSQEKIDKAVKLGAKGGVSYKEKDWDKKLREMIGKGNLFDAIVDGAGADVVEKGSKLLKAGGTIAIYGMTTSPKAPFLMQAVLKNIEVKGSTMGSRKEFKDMIDFMREKKAVPVVSRSVKGFDLDQVNGLFEDMKNGTQFGKLVVDLSQGLGGGSSAGGSKL